MMARFPPKAPTGMPPTDHFAQRGQVGHDSIETLRALQVQPEAGHDLVEDEHRAVPVA